LKNAHLSICNKLNIGKKLVDWRGIPEHQEYTLFITTAAISKQPSNRMTTSVPIKIVFFMPGYLVN
ncbi:MAG: hypothetical protein ACRERV_04930, partial [Methylococcales bacterium]